MPQMQTDELQGLLDKRATVIAEMRKIGDRVKNSGKAWSAEDSQEFDRYQNEAADLKTKIKDIETSNKRFKQIDDLESELNSDRGRKTNPNNHAPGDTENRRSSKDFNVVWTPKGGHHARNIKGSSNRATSEYAEVFNSYLAGQRLSHDAMNSLQSDDEESAGYLVADMGFVSELLKEVDDAVFIQSLSRVLPLTVDRATGIRKRTSKTNTFAKGSELKDITTEDQFGLTYGRRVLTPHYHSGWIRVSRDLIRSSSMPVEQMVRDEIVTMLAEYLEQLYLTGTGAQEPLGVLTASSDGISTARDIAVLAGEITTPTSQFGVDTLHRAKYNLKQKYRNKARWMFHRDAMSFLTRLKDGENRYLWQPSIVAGEPDRLLNLPFDESEWMPNTFSAGNYFGILGVWDYYYISYSLMMEFQRMNELAARTNEYEYHVRIKMDAQPVLEEAFTRLKFAAS